MAWKSISVVPVLLCAAVAGGCDSSFSPKGPFKNDVVVVSVLTADKGPQFVRLYSAYDPPAFDASAVTVDNPILAATVVLTDISGGGGTYALHDTSVQRLDTARYNSPIHAYVTSDFIPSAGQRVGITASSPGTGTQTASTTLPGHAQMYVAITDILDHPGRYSDYSIEVVANISYLTRGYLVRIFLEYEYLEGSTKVIERRDVPVSILTWSGNGGTITVPTYPSLSRRTSSPSATTPNTELVFFENAAYQFAVTSVRSQYGAKSLRFRNAIVALTQAEQNFYNYFKITNAFEDPQSIRTDQPDYTNISGGVGIFGGRTLDSLVVPVPDL